MDCNFSNIAFTICGFDIYWYSLAYIVGILMAFQLTKYLIRVSNNTIITNSIAENFISWVVVGIIVGGRLGFVFFYEPEEFIENPISILQIWHGGMAFFGGLSGVIIAAYLYCKKYNIPLLQFLDFWAVGAPIGLFFGRIANFINGELLGMPVECEWGAIFKDGVPRHPSQLYEAFSEGLLLFLIMMYCFRKGFYKKEGVLSGVFAIGYGSARFICEFFRCPDSNLSRDLFYYTNINFNQYISIFLILFGIYFVKNVRSEESEKIISEKNT